MRIRQAWVARVWSGAGGIRRPAFSRVAATILAEFAHAAAHTVRPERVPRIGLAMIAVEKRAG
jgi:hypothetical protein